MTNKILALSLASMLAFCGCSKAETAETEAQTEPATEITAATTTGEWYYFDLPKPESFPSYQALINDINSDDSSDIYIHPLPEIVDTWEFDYASRCSSNYTVCFNDNENDVFVMLEIGYVSSYDKISEYIDKLGYMMDTEVAELYDRYAVRHYTDDDTYAIIGITGEDNIRYTLLARSDDETKDPVALLKEYKNVLEL